MPRGQRLQSWEVNRIADLIATGKSNVEIGVEMSLTSETIRQWRKRQGKVLNGHAPKEQTAEEAVLQVYVESSDFPEIKALIARQQKYRAMAKSAEDLGDDDLSLLIMQRMELTPLEQEILRYWAEVHAKE